jgi:hypothetical protein
MTKMMMTMKIGELEQQAVEGDGPWKRQHSMACLMKMMMMMMMMMMKGTMMLTAATQIGQLLVDPEAISSMDCLLSMMHEPLSSHNVEQSCSYLSMLQNLIQRGRAIHNLAVDHSEMVVR